jgi:hypothetical protein
MKKKRGEVLYGEEELTEKKRKEEESVRITSKYERKSKASKLRRLQKEMKHKQEKRKR